MENFTPLVEFQNKVSLKINGININNKQTNNLGKIKLKERYKVSVTYAEKAYDFQLTFTNLPIVQVTCDSEIYDDPKTLARIQLYKGSQTPPSQSFIGIEYRGKFSRSFAKKSFGFCLRENGLSDKEYSANLLKLGNNSNWILNSSIIDPSRFRNAVSFNIWEAMGNTGDIVDANHYAIYIKPVELFFNNDFRGVYLFSENINNLFLQAPTNAVLYKGIEWADGATCFECFHPVLSANQYWNGWEQKYPDRKEQINWLPLNELYKTVVNSSDHEFKRNISSLINVRLLIDYFLLLNLTSAGDNTGKNVFLYKKSPDAIFEIIPWDLDGSWGIQYDGQRVSANSILSNNLFLRLYKTNTNNYRESIKERWFELRQTVFSEDNIQQEFDGYFQLLNSSDIIQMENQQWNLTLNTNEEQAYIKNWITLRLQFLDDYFSSY